METKKKTHAFWACHRLNKQASMHSNASPHHECFYCGEALLEAPCTFLTLSATSCCCLARSEPTPGATPTPNCEFGRSGIIPMNEEFITMDMGSVWALDAGMDDVGNSLALEGASPACVEGGIRLGIAGASPSVSISVRERCISPTPDRLRAPSKSSVDIPSDDPKPPTGAREIPEFACSGNATASGGTFAGALNAGMPSADEAGALGIGIGSFGGCLGISNPGILG